MSTEKQQNADPEKFPLRLPGNEGMNCVLYEGEYFFYVDEHLAHRCDIDGIVNLYIVLRTYLQHARHPALNRPFPAMPPSEATDAQ